MQDDKLTTDEMVTKEVGSDIPQNQTQPNHSIQMEPRLPSDLFESEVPPTYPTGMRYLPYPYPSSHAELMELRRINQDLAADLVPNMASQECRHLSESLPALPTLSQIQPYAIGAGGIWPDQVAIDCLNSNVNVNFNLLRSKLYGYNRAVRSDKSAIKQDQRSMQEWSGKENKKKTGENDEIHTDAYCVQSDDDAEELHSREDKSHSPTSRCMGKCGSCCMGCLRKCRLPRWLRKPLLLVYTATGGVFTYALLLVFTYTTIWSINPSLAVPPVCRSIAVPFLKNSTTTPEPSTTPGLKPGYEEALVCKGGEALSVLIYYGFGFMVGELMELLHLPGLLGMLLGGLALRNIGVILIPQQIFHEGKYPNGSYALSGDPNPSIGDSDAVFTVLDPLTRFAASLLVNTALSGALRRLALTTILTRAGLGIDPSTLKQVFASVFRLAFIPCFAEALTLMVITRWLIKWPWAWGAILGFVCAAVSPAVIVPNMMRLEVSGWGVAEGIPTLVVAASSLDDVIAITGFGVALAVGLSTENSLVHTVIMGPVEAIGGAVFGAAVGTLLCFFPPPKLEHSHIIRGILLLCIAITCLLGSIELELPGAGALAVLTMAFVVATGWRSGLPWRLIQDDESPIAEENIMALDELNSQIPCTPGDDYQPSLPPRSPTTTCEGNESNELPKSKIGVADISRSAGLSKGKSSQPEPMTSADMELGFRNRRRHKSSAGSNILETLVEYHPYYCSILRQQYRHPAYRGFSSQSSASRRSTRGIAGGDLPSLAVAVAATGTERRDSTTPNSSRVPSMRGSRRATRRFSLPEPTAHYELESFSTYASIHRKAPRPSANRAQMPPRRRLLTPTFREQYAIMYNQPVDKLEEQEEEYDDEHHLDVRSKRNESGPTGTNMSAVAEEAASGSPAQPGSQTTIVQIPATPWERGVACLNALRQTLAAIWWFIQPLLFSLIGAEVNLHNLKGSSTGLGILSLILAIFVRLAATVVAVLPSKMNMKERLFVAFSWLPKATVQAAIGPVALDTARQMNAPPEIIGYGEQVLTLAAIAILLTAPLGAALMPLTAPYLLRQDLSASEVLIAKTKRNPALEEDHKQKAVPMVHSEETKKDDHVSPSSSNTKLAEDEQQNFTTTSSRH